MLIIRATKNARKKGSIKKLVWFAKNPNRGGIKVEPMYALAIWIPIIAPEFSAPKFAGVE